MLFNFLLIYLVRSECEFPTLSIGNFNISSERQLKDIIKKEPTFLIGISSKDCEECCRMETYYNSFMEVALKYSPKIPLMRYDASSSNFISKYIGGIDSVPALYGVRKGVFHKFFDLPDSMKILRFVDKLISPIYHMDKLEDVLEFLSQPKGDFQSLKILGLFEEKDLVQEYEEAIRPFSSWFAADFRVVTDKQIITEVRKLKPEITQMNTLILMRVDDTKYLDLEVPQDIRSWVAQNSVGLVEELRPYNFQMYAATGAPMLVMFIDPANIYSPLYLDEYKKSARKFEGRVKYAWLNGTNPEYIEKRNKLGLATEIFPALAFNSKNSVNYPMAEGNEVNEKTIDTFVQGYLDGKKNTLDGTYQFNGVTLDDCEKLSSELFGETVLNSEEDVLVIVYSSHLSKDSQKSANNLNRVCRRFKELDVEGVKVFAFDAAKGRVYKNVLSNKFPTVFLKKAETEELIYFEGNANALEIMKFVEKNSSKGLRLPELPHLDSQEIKDLQRVKNEINSFEGDEREEL